MLAVSTAATRTALTTLSALKAELDLTANGEDVYLRNQINAVSALVCQYLDVAVAGDGTRTLGREVLVETVRLDRRSYGLPSRMYSNAIGRSTIVLSRTPVVSIASVVEDDEAVDPANYEVNGANGILQRLDNGLPRDFWATKTVVTYTAGWLLPGDSARNFPFEIEDAVIKLIKAERFARKRDPLLKSDDVAGVGRQDFWVGGVGDGGAIPPDIAAQIEKFRNISVG